MNLAIRRTGKTKPEIREETMTMCLSSNDKAACYERRGRRICGVHHFRNPSMCSIEFGIEWLTSGWDYILI